MARVEIYKGFWTREQVTHQQDKVYLFGDNTHGRTKTHYIPSMTQAVIRGLPNAIGIDTKKNRWKTADFLLKRYKDLPRYIGLGEPFETIDEEFQFSELGCPISEFFGCIYRAYKIATLNGVSDEDFRQTYRNLFIEKI